MAWMKPILRAASGRKPITFRALKLGLLLAAIFAGWGAPAGLAVPLRIVDLNQFQQQDLRALSMGNAFGSVARGEAALQYNPAGLATYDFDLKADFSVTFMEQKGNFINDTVKLSSGTPTQADEVNYVQKYNGTTQTFALQTFPSAVANLGQFHLGLGAGNLDVQRYQLVFDPFVPPPAGPAPTAGLTVSKERAQLGLGGLALSLAGGKVLIGATAKTVRYSEASSTVTYSAILAGTKIDVNPAPTEYNQVAAYDVGMIYRVEWLPALKPQWSLTAYNVGGFKLKGATPAGVAQMESVPDTYNFGFSLQPDFGFVHVLMTAEVEDLTDSVKFLYDPNAKKPVPVGVPIPAGSVYRSRDESQRLHGGIEVGLFKTPTGNNWINLRGGSNRGNLTYGAELNLGGFTRFVYSYGTEDFGFKKHPQYFRYEAYQLALGLAW